MTFLKKSLSLFICFSALVSFTTQSEPLNKRPDLLATPMPEVSQGKIVRLEQGAVDFGVLNPRPIDVWLPADYPAKAPYAVVYMHDGQMLYDAEKAWNKMAWEMDEAAAKLNQQSDTKPFIVVGVHNAGPSRHSEYFPQKPFEALPKAAQQALYQTERSANHPLFAEPVYSDQYAAFLALTLKPYIDSHFKVATDKANTFVMGSSMGGLISWYTALEYPQVFGGAACLSTHWPGEFVDNDPIPNAFIAHLVDKLKSKPQVKLYFDYGDQTLDAMYPKLQAKVDQAIKDIQYDTRLWQTHFFEGENHSEKAWADRVTIPLTFLLNNSR